MSLDPLAQINAIYDDPTKKPLIFNFFHESRGTLAKFGECFTAIKLKLNLHEEITGITFEKGSQIVEAAYKARKIFELYNIVQTLPGAGLCLHALRTNITNPAYASIQMIFQMSCPYAAPLMPIPEGLGVTASSIVERAPSEITLLKQQLERAGQEITSLKSQVSQSNRKLKEAEKDQDLLKQQISSLVARASESERSTPSSSEWQTKCIALDIKLKEALAEKSQLEKKNSELERMKSPTWLSSLLFLFKPVLGFLVFITRPLLRLFGFSH